MAIDPRAKGARGELELVKILKEATGLPWIRTPMSGATNFAKGDIMLDIKSGKISKYLIEAKLYSEDTINSNLLNPSNSQLEKFLEQTEREASQMNSLPMLVFRKDRAKWLVAVKEEYPNLNYIKFKKKEYSYYIYLFSDLLELVKGNMTK